MTAFEVMQKHYRQRDLAAREWKQKGGQVVGYFCDNVPEELISAAGFFPLRISGDPCGSTEIARQHFLVRARKREDFVHSMLNRLLTGEYDFLDYLVIPHARDTIRRLYLLLSDLQQSDPSLKLPKLYYLDVLHTLFFSSSVYNRTRLIEFKKMLEAWSGKEITRESLSQAIAVSNENKILLKKVAALRAAETPQISGVEALQIIGSSMFMLKQEHNQALKQYLNEVPNRPASKAARIFVEGSPLDNLQLYQLLESSGITVVAEDNCWGNRYSDVPIDTSLDPLEAIIDRYHNKSPCSRMFPMTRRVNYCVENTLMSKARGVIFYVYALDGAEALETPDKIKALEAKGIPSLYLKKQPYLISDQDQLKNSVDSFINGIAQSG
jgi:benzoyl-CoA reductase/2-hydroxyglutaryl-CoA dehydratase subunit BcrC/BadD/HgdB